MNLIGRYTRYDTWTVEQLVDATEIEPRGNKRVTIPEFQRRIVWSRQKQEDLITSIKNGFPFGSLLLAQDSDSTDTQLQFKLIDGLQRTQTLRKYSSQPNSSFRATEIADELVLEVAHSLNEWSDIDCTEETNVSKIRDMIRDWIWDRPGFAEADGWSAIGLTDKLLRDMLELDEDSYDYFIARRELTDTECMYHKRVQSFLDSIRKTSDIATVEVPVIIFAGPSSELAHIFTLLNTQGIRLSRYEIYAAQWLDYRYQIANLEIIDAIWRKYAELQKHGFNLDVAIAAPNEASRLSREYTLFEYVFGLGQCLTRKYQAFFKPVKPDAPSPVGFNLLSASVGTGVADKDVKRLPDEMRGLELSKLEQCLLESVEFVYQVMHPVLSCQRIDSNKLPYFHSDLQIVSMVAAAFRVRYDPNDLSELDGWMDSRVTLSKSLPMHYLFDIIQESWKGSGDNRLREILASNAYLETMQTKNTWEQVLNIWHEGHLRTRVHSNSYVKDDYSEYLFLRYVFVSRLQESKGFHVLHIVPVSRLISPPSHYHGMKGPINSIGNMALMAQDDFVDYGDLTFVEYLKRLQREGKLGSIQYHATLESHEKLLVCSASQMPSLELKKREFEEFLVRRFELLKAEFFKVWSDHIPPDPQT